jgi:hypothetical protein
MEFIFLFAIAPFILLIAISYWPLYRVLRKKNFPFAEARSLLPSWIALLSLTTKATLEQFIPNIQADAAPSDQPPIEAGIYSFQNKLNDRRNQGENMANFRFVSDGEQAFVHAPDGISNLSYNSGTAGHLMGDWYWFCED